MMRRRIGSPRNSTNVSALMPDRRMPDVEQVRGECRTTSSEIPNPKFQIPRKLQAAEHRTSNINAEHRSEAEWDATEHIPPEVISCFRGLLIRCFRRARRFAFGGSRPM